MGIRANLLKGMDTWVGSPLCRLTGVMTWYRYRDQQIPITPGLSSIRRILVIRPGGIGDMIVLLPALQALSQACPDAQLDIACEQRNRGICSLAPFPCHPIPMDTQPVKFLAQLARNPYAWLTDTEQFHHFSSLFAYWSRAPMRIGFNINPRRNALYTHRVDYAPDGFEGEQFMRLLQPLGIPPQSSRLDACLKRHVAGLSIPPPSLAIPNDPYLVLHPFTGAHYKQWPSDRLVELEARLHASPGLVCVLSGGSTDRPSCETLAHAIEKHGIPVCNLAGKLTLPQTARLLEKAALFVGLDSGMAHLAVAMGAPTVILFGASDARKWGTTGLRHAVVRNLLPCAPCCIFGYHKPCRHLACMQGIPVDDVITACQRVLTAGD